MRHLLSWTDWSSGDIQALLRVALRVKERPAVWRGALAGKTLAMIFEKSSTRTRVSFQVGASQLGGNALFLSKNDLQLGRGETVEDTARVLARYVDAIMARVYDHATLQALAQGGVPVINGLSDLVHPCQALADMLTLRERFGSIEGLELAYVGDGNNTCNSLINITAKLGVGLRVAAPQGYQPVADVVDAARSVGGRLLITEDPVEAVTGAHAVYTDVWTSMGQEAEKAQRRKVFAPYIVDEELFSKAKPEAVFLHCLPAYRGVEVTNGVVDHERSAVLDEAENRLHAQKAILLHLMAGVPL